MQPLLTAGGGDITHAIQTALAPIFLLTGIGALLNVFNQRLVRVSDHIAHIADLIRAADDDSGTQVLFRHLLRLSRRRSALDVSVICAALAGTLTCAAAFTLFVVTVRDAEGTLILIWIFGLALGFTIASLAAFIVDTVLAWHGLRREGPMPRNRRA